MDKSRITYLIQKLRSNQATAIERDELEAFWDLAQKDDTLIVELSIAEKESIRRAIFEGIQLKINAQEERRSASQYVMRPSGWLLKIAASIIFLITLSVLWTETRENLQEFHTGYGEQLTLMLPDDSKVVINGNSSLRYNASWSDGEDREVWIEGEGFFEVTHTLSNQKFIVHTQNEMDVQVLGTKFNVRTRRGKTEVMLQEGRVRLDVEKNELSETMMLQPGELATLKGSKLLKVKTIPSEYAAWKEHKLFFDQTPLHEVADILEDTYGLTVVFADEELAMRKLSGEISSDDAADILEAIEESFDIGTKQEGHRVVFHQKN